MDWTTPEFRSIICFGDNMDRYVKKAIDKKCIDLMISGKRLQMDYYPNFINAEWSKLLFDQLLDKTNWRQGVYNMYGKQVLTPRMLAAMCEETDDICDVYDLTSAEPWSSCVSELKDFLEIFLNKKFRYVQINWYRNGSDHIGFHDDKEVKEGDCIASVSIGARRKFVLQHKSDKSIKSELYLDNGSLLVMPYQTCKTDWKHAIVKEAKITEGRINLTFRER